MVGGLTSNKIGFIASSTKMSKPKSSKHAASSLAGTIGWRVVEVVGWWWWWWGWWGGGDGCGGCGGGGGCGGRKWVCNIILTKKIYTSKSITTYREDEKGEVDHIADT